MSVFGELLPRILNLLTIGAVTERYYFMQTIQKVFDFDKRSGFPTIVWCMS